MTDELERYVLNHIPPESEYLHRLWREANLRTVHGHMQSGHLQGRLLTMLARMVRPKHVLEVGTFSGYSAICLAEGLDEGAAVWTFDVNDELEETTRRWIDGSTVAEKIHFRIGNALTEVPKMGILFDLIYLDGDKRTYIETYEMALAVLREGGFLLADNTLWDGHVIETAYDRDPQTIGIRRFNDHVAADERVEKVIIPLRDGLTVIRKKPLSKAQ